MNRFQNFRFEPIPETVLFHFKAMPRLKIQPESFAGSQEARKPYGCIGCYRAFPLHNFVDSSRWHANILCQSIFTNSHRTQKILKKDITGVNRTVFRCHLFFSWQAEADGTSSFAVYWYSARLSRWGAYACSMDGRTTWQRVGHLFGGGPVFGGAMQAPVARSMGRGSLAAGDLARYWPCGETVVGSGHGLLIPRRRFPAGRLPAGGAAGGCRSGLGEALAAMVRGWARPPHLQSGGAPSAGSST